MEMFVNNERASSAKNIMMKGDWSWARHKNPWYYKLC